MDRAPDIQDIVSARTAKGEPFALATVVRTVAATAAKAGAKAVILPDGTISEGWIGGGCARAAVVKAAKDALADGVSRLVSVQPPDALNEQGIEAGAERAGIRFAKNMCPSQGTMDIFVEPVLPRPQVIICGASPVAVAIADFAKRAGFMVTACAPAASRPPSTRSTAPSKVTRCRSTKRDPATWWYRRKGAATRRRCWQRCRSMPTMSPSSAAAAKPKRCARPWPSAASRRNGWRN